ncbi:MAG TPA: heme o synthase [Spirochaetia bacterium]|nr:heme o synthase [Spirochaetia bacterium]
MSQNIQAARRPRPRLGRLQAYFDLTKPRITLLVLAVAAGSFCLASMPSVPWLRLLETMAGVTVLAFGIFALNHYAERDTDALMLRTSHRPLPSGRIKEQEALAFGTALTAAAVAGFFLALGVAAGLVAVATFISYIFLYTPLKRRTMHHTIPGAVSGAMPPLLGWASARGTLGLEAWVLFGILFFWQFPHFLALELMYREDYQRGGIRVITASNVSGAWVFAEIMAALVFLAAASIAPFFLGMAGTAYLIGAVVLVFAFAIFAARAAVRKDKRSGRLLLRASVAYLPVLFLLLVLTHTA